MTERARNRVRERKGELGLIMCPLLYAHRS